MSLALQYVTAMAPQRALATQVECQSFAIQTTDVNGDVVNKNQFESKEDVYLNGGPGPSGTLTPGTTIYYQVQEPDGTPLDEIRSTTVKADSSFRVQLAPFDTTSNSGGEYKVVASTLADLSAGACTKSDNFKVPPTGYLKIVKEVDGGEVSGDFKFHVDCGDGGTFDVTVTFPDPGSVTIDDIPAGSVCDVTETGNPDAPAGFHWGNPTVTDNPATIEADKTVWVHFTNHLIQDNGSLKVTKVVTGGTSDATFTIHVDCGQAFTDDVTLTAGQSFTKDDLPAGTECTVTEPSQPAAPDGFKWNDAQISGSPATIEADDTASVTVTNPLEALPPPNTPALTIEKSNNAPIVNTLPTADEGDTVTYTLDYDLTDGPVHNGVITDVLPVGVTYVSGSASSNAEFTFQSYDSGTRTLTWTATEVTADGSVTYQATVDEGATELAQPLENTASIVSDETEKDSDISDVFVAPPPQAETSVPNTAPPTDTFGSTDSAAPGASMLLILLALAGIALAVMFVAPTPASIRKRMR